MRRAVLAFCLCVVFSGTLSGCYGAEEVPLPPQPVTDVFILTQSGEERVFLSEIVDTPEKQERGMMFRMAMAPDDGMLFLFPESAERVFWMKNTRIPLDMLFIDVQGRVLTIHRNARPLDLSPISSGGPVSAVLEIPGGRADVLGIQEGDTVRYTIP